MFFERSLEHSREGGQSLIFVHILQTRKLSPESKVACLGSLGSEVKDSDSSSALVLHAQFWLNRLPPCQPPLPPGGR